MDSIVSSRVKLHVSVTAITSSRRSHLTVCALLPATEVGVVGRGTPPVQSRLCDLLFFFFFGERWSATRTPFFSFLISWELELRNYELAAHAFTHSFIHSLTCSSRLIAKDNNDHGKYYADDEVAEQNSLFSPFESQFRMRLQCPLNWWL